LPDQDCQIPFSSKTVGQIALLRFCGDGHESGHTRHGMN
jgi:hypothetical protein